MRNVLLSQLAAVCLLLSACSTTNQSGKLPKDDVPIDNSNLLESVTLVGQVGNGIALPVDQCEESDDQGAASRAPATASRAPAVPSPNLTHSMGALLKPLVGLDPNIALLYEQPMIKARTTALLGSHYDTVIQLLKTADELQQEGPLFFVVSKFTPFPAVAEKAGLVWNSDTDQMAVAMLKGDGLQIISEAVQHTAIGQANTTETHAVPLVWPAVMQAWARCANC